ncbi:hypothetical protein J2767_003598 [Agrobacterium tumefaciens]|uniref:hypothetical protein n=1 Tax=Agrobacterium tumefaciens TaxID=358 RepID=UPI001AE74D7B|nr:hypothetical protein [Agrobacterium tumefaciens]MBP2572420.1 hypothetical protein [Agrobacterium tumefaciens]
MRAIVLLLVGAFATPSYGQVLAEFGPNSNEHPFQCGAAFAIMAKVYQEAGDAKKSAGYQTKFDKLAAKAEGIFEQSHRSKSDAEAYMQKHVDSLAAVAKKDAALVVNFTRRCDQRFPS